MVKPDTGQANFSENNIRSGPLLSWILAVSLVGLLFFASARAHRRVGVFDHGEPLGELQRGLETFREALADIRPHHDAVDDDVDVVREFLVERGRL